MRYDDYVAELPYAENNYQPLHGRQNHFCQDCHSYYNTLYEDGLTKRPFPFRYTYPDGRKAFTCTFDKRLDKEYVRRENFDSDEDYEEAILSVDPVTWAYAELGWEPRWYQEEILCCTAQFKAVRAGRRVGKTASLSVLALWYAVTNKNFEILIVCPYVAQVAKIMDNIRELFGRSPNVENSIVRNTKSSPQIIEFANGSKIRGFAAGGASSGKSDQIRGQDANLIIMDEVDYISDGDIEVIMAILTSNQNTKVIVSSTPRGIRSRLFEWSRDKDGRWKEFWYISAEGPAWSQETEDFYKQMYSQGGYAREFLAEFGEEMQGVFRAKDLAKCTYNYKYEDCVPQNDQAVYVIGVDWNKITGTHICVVERPRTGATYYKLVEKKIIRKSEFTQIEGVKAIIELYKKWGASHVYCDAGYGHTQIEMLWAQDLKDHTMGMRKAVVGIEMNSNITIFDPIKKEEIKKPAKPLMVYFAANRVERHQVMFPESEDTATQIVPEELAFADIGIVQQARSFMVTKISPTGRETFSQDYEHTLTAWMLAIMGHLLEYGDYQKINYTTHVGKTGDLGMQSGRQKIRMRDEFGRLLPDKIVQEQIERARIERAVENSERATAAKERTRKDWREDDTNVNKITPGTGARPTHDENGNLLSYKMGQALIAINGVAKNRHNSNRRWKRRDFGGTGRGLKRRGL